jgi:sugar O-acyltransferase (sialic acid O-acetyltransferase NeuD family)
MESPVIILGAGYLGRAAKELFELNNVVIYGFLDDEKKLHHTEIDGVIVLGSTDDDGFLKLIGKRCEAFIALDDNRLRKNAAKILTGARHKQPVNAIHKLAYISSHADMGHGNFIDMGVTLSTGASLGNYCIVNAGVILGVDAKVGDYAQIGAGSVIGAGVFIEEEVFIGAGSTVVAGVTIGKGARVGAGSVVIAPVAPGETVFGNPAVKVK